MGLRSRGLVNGSNVRAGTSEAREETIDPLGRGKDGNAHDRSRQGLVHLDDELVNPPLGGGGSAPSGTLQQFACCRSQGSGSIAVAPFSKTSKWRCAPKDLPVSPVRPMYSPTVTASPTWT